MAQDVCHVVQRADAIAAGQRWYFTGKPCLRGHVAKRNVRSFTCHTCASSRIRQIRAADPEPFRAKDRSRQGDSRRETSRRSRLKFIDARRQSDSDRYHNNEARKAATKARAVQWGKLNKGKRNRIVAARRWWIKRATPPWLTTEQTAEIAAVYLEAARRSESVDHIYPLRAKNSCGLHVPWNLQIIPLLDNVRKGNRIDGAE